MTKSAWTLAAIKELNAQHSWTGRIHIHKLLYLTHALLGIPVPFSFDLYRFGPYSFDLDEHMRELTTFGFVSTTIVDEAYGPKHELAVGVPKLIESDSRLKLDVKDAAELNKMASAIGNSTSGDLELIATCLWVEQNEHRTGQTDVVDRVKIIKPRYSIETIQAQFQALQSLKQTLKAS